MKKILLFSTFLALLATSCTFSDSEVDNIDVNSDFNLGSFSANIDSEQSRTYAAKCDDRGLQLYWHTDDCIMVYDAAGAWQRYKLQSGADTTQATFVFDELYSNNQAFTEEAMEYYAVSPSGKDIYVSENGVKVNLSSLQHHIDYGQNDQQRHLMVGKSIDGGLSFDFKLFAALARLDIRLEGEEKLLQVEIQTDNTAISGVADVDWDGLSYISNSAVNTIDSNKKITLTYGAELTSPNAEGYAQILPIDWTKVDDKVYYTITTDKSVYTFCKKPVKEFKAGYIYTLPLWVDAFEKVDSEAELTDGKYCKVDANIGVYVAQVRATDSTITIGWTVSDCNLEYIGDIMPHMEADYSVDITKVYKVALYSDAECRNLVTSVDNLHKDSDTTGSKFVMIDNVAPPRFAFAGLMPATTYYAKVWNTTDGTHSNVIKVATIPSVADKSSVVKSNANVGDLILFENFSAIVYGGEMTSRGASISRTDRGNLNEIAPVTGQIVAGQNNYVVCSSGNEIGLFNTLKNLLDDFGLQDWGWIGGKADATGGSICARPGYLKVGTGSNRSFICTPQLTAIPSGKAATLRVEFAAAPYGEYNKRTITPSEKYMSVRALVDPQFASSNKVSYKLEACDAQSLTIDGEAICDWGNYSVTLTNVPSGASVAIGGGHDATTTNRMLIDDIRIYVEQLVDYIPPQEPELLPISGTITYNDGTPAAGVSVSDGFTVVQTDDKGKYSITPNIDTWYIYYSIPENCQVPINSYGQPCFFTKYSKSQTTYNFTLNKLPGGKETNFTLFCLADPQCKDNRETDNKGRRHGDRFKNESVPAIKGHAATKTVPCYATTLGDVVYSEGSRNNQAFMPTMRDYMHVDKIGMPVFQVMGNHDYTYFHTNNPINADATSSTYNIKAQRAFEDTFGPINYSWTRGDVHFIAMRTMQWTKNDTWSAYSTAFTKEQVEWLRQDLAVVPKSKMVILCVHIPISTSSDVNIQSALTLIKQYKEAHIMSGHTHYMRNIASSNLFEHVHAAVCGQWWWSNMNADGVPNGYGVYDIEGNTIKNWYYMGVNNGMNDRNYQMRLYRGDIKGGTPTKSFNSQLGHGVLLANVFNCDSSWKVYVYEDGTKTGQMTLMSQKKYSADTLGDYPCLVPTDSSQDWWSIGYHIGVVGRGKNSSYSNACFHMYKYTLKNPNCTNIQVEATDRFGNKYTCSEITADYDYTLMN